jgi:hypothetical protein
MPPQTIGHHQYGATCPHVVVEQLWSQLVILYPQYLTGEIEDHEMVLVVLTLQAPIREPEDRDLIGYTVGTKTFCHERMSCFDRATMLRRKSSMVWKRWAGATHLHMRKNFLPCGSIVGNIARGSKAKTS